MPGLLRPMLTLALAAAAAAAISACGSGADAKLLPGQTAREITANLNAVQQLAAEGDCSGAESAARQVGEQVEGLAGVAPKLKQALEQGSGRLNEVVAQCEEAPTEVVAPPTEPPEPQEKPKKEEKEKEPKEPAEEKPKEQPPPPPEHELPPQSNGKGKGLEKEPPAEEEAEAPPSGGVGPGSAVGEGE